MSNNNNMTRQGVRNLNIIKAPNVHKKYVEPPVAVNCKHPNMKMNKMLAFGHCPDCGYEFDPYAR